MEQGALARSVQADQSVDFPGGDAQVYRAEGGVRAEGFADSFEFEHAAACSLPVRPRRAKVAPGWRPDRMACCNLINK